METKETVDKAFNEILDCFGGTDGGISFVKTRSLIEDMQKKSENGDESATKIVAIVMQFSRLIKFSRRIKIAQTTKETFSSGECEKCRRIKERNTAGPYCDNCRKSAN